MKLKVYKNYMDEYVLDTDTVLVSVWNAYIEEVGSGNKIHFNDVEFFKRSFKNSYDAVLAVSLSNKWRWTDTFVVFDEEGHLSSFNHWDDENSPIDRDKIDVSHLIDALKNFNKQDKQGQENDISRAIHNALKEV